MFNRESILKTLNSENYYIDKHSLDLFLNDWKIDSIYEDEDGLEFYNEYAWPITGHYRLKDNNTK